MGYQECYKETNELAAERYELVAERIAEIAEAAQAPEPFAEYFRTNAAYLQSLRALYEKGKSGSLAARSMEECEADNEALYGEILPEAPQDVLNNSQFPSRNRSPASSLYQN